MAGREAMIAQAEKSLGLAEGGPNRDNNVNYITNWYGLNGEPWCDQAISYWAWHSGNEQAVCFGGKFAYTVYHAQAFQQWHQWHTDVAGIQRGDIVFFDWSGSNNVAAIDHVGIVTGTQGDAVLTIEGNIGNVCARKVRYAGTIVGYGRPAYAETPAPPSTDPPKPTAYEPFPGASWFHNLPRDSRIRRMGTRLVQEKCSAYRVGPSDQWTETDRKSYAKWQRKCGFSGADANGWPGKTSWDKLRVPKG